MIAHLVSRASSRSALFSGVLVALLILWAVYPGFMSYDSLHALREARTEVRGGPYPPFVSYVWRPLDMLFPGPAAMLFMQNAVLLVAIACFLLLSGFGAGATIFALPLIALAPPLLGPMLVVWKDVAMSASFAAAAAILYAVQAGALFNRSRWLVAALVLSFCGMAFRLNALPAAAPLLIWAAAIHFRANAVRHPLASAIFAGGALTALLFAGVMVLNTYRLPGFSRLDQNYSVQSLQLYDLIGTTAISGRIAFAPPPPHDAGAFVSEAARIYDPRHINITLLREPNGLFQTYGVTTPREELSRAWLATVTSMPSAYFRHRAAVFSELVGFAPTPVFYPTHGGIDQNEYGYVHVPTWGSKHLMSYLLEACGPLWTGSLACRAFVYPLAGLLMAILCLAIGPPAQRAAAAAVYASGLAYLLPQFLITPAADLRYTHWSVVASILVGVIAIGTLLSRWQAPKGARSIR